MRAILDTKDQSPYDDDVAERYHFPKRYLNILSQCVGDWIIFRQPRALGGTLAYFATARVSDIISDPTNNAYFYALIENFSPFDVAVPWRIGGRYAERALRELPDVSRLGLYLRGKSVRALDDDDFVDIVEEGFRISWNLNSPPASDLDSSAIDVLAARLQSREARKDARLIASCLTNRKVRDRSFRTAVCGAYGNRCAVSGLALQDHNGLYEVQAAHIVPVADGGHDVVPNGIALSATLHWLFDRHLISVDQDMTLMLSPLIAQSSLRTFIGCHGKPILLPSSSKLAPAERNLLKHRQRFQAFRTIPGRK